VKKLLLSISILVFSLGSNAQVTCGFIAGPEDWDFENVNIPFDYFLHIDSISNPLNSWQIGVPQKATINSAYSPSNVIITNTVNSYPINETSVFIFTHIDQGGYSAPHSAELSGYYNVNTDSLNDFGTIEISLDQGTSWINLITDTTYAAYYYWNGPKPVLTGNSNGWQNFWVSLASLGNVFPVNYNDTILLKFTFISDSIPDTLDGLAFDSFQFCDGIEGIEKISRDNLITLYPNPTQDLLFINRRNPEQKEKVQVFNYSGQLLYEDANFTGNSIDTKAIQLKDGFYFLSYSYSSHFAMKKFAVQH
jgi:Secretion system C-terminal sorting domain